MKDYVASGGQSAGARDRKSGPAILERLDRIERKVDGVSEQLVGKEVDDARCL
jgi:hypothetical protein